MSLTLVLNPEQQKAVEYGEGPLLVIAGPGSGKTRVITERIVHLMERRNVAPRAILALTFTDKAADEMRRRVQAALPGLDTIPRISTFHAFCYQVLRERHFDRQLLDKVDVWIFLRRRIGELGLDYYQKLAEPGAFLHDLNEFFSRCQDELIEPEDFEAYVQQFGASLRRRYPDLRAAAGSSGSFLHCVERAQTSVLEPAPPLEEEELARKTELARVFRKSRGLIETAGYSSFGSLLSETLRLWERDPDVLDRLQARYSYILVDEFQDTNFAQVELLRRLVTDPFNVTAVGDDDQAIYRFRGASHGAFQMFDRIFPGRAVIHLDRNYRSTQKILRAAGVVIAKNDRYEEKRALRTDRAEGPDVCLVESPDYLSEAAWIAGEVARLRGRGMKFGEMAVLYRGHNHRDPLVEEFRRREIPFDIRGLSILSTAILRDLVAYLNLVHSPRHNVSLTRVLLAPRWRFPEELALDIREQASKLRCSLYEALEARERTLFRGDLESTAWPELKELLNDLRRVTARMPLPLVLDTLVRRLGIAFLADDPDRAQVTAFRKFLEEWQRKYELAAESAHPQNGRPRARSELAAFMDYFEYFTEAGGIIEAPESAGPTDAVQMMTVHAAKGLEFPAVFVLSVARQRFPHRRETPVIEFPDELRKGPPPPPDIHLQEERRLFYVAMTRAEERLYISSVVQPPRKPSVFVDDLLRDPAVAARDIERIQAPQVAPVRQAPAGTVSRPTRLEANPPGGTDAMGQGILFADLSEPDSPVHPDLQAWINNPTGLPQMARNGKLILSATSIEAYRDCPLRFKFSHYLRIPTAPQAALTFGSIMHQSVRHYFELRKKVLPCFEDVALFYARSWKDRGFEDLYQEEAYRNAGLEQLREFVKQQNARQIDSERTVFEQGFSLDLGEVALIGRIDQINPVDPSGGESRDSPGPARLVGQGSMADLPVELIDYKTGRSRSQKDAEKSLQLSVYALAARRVLKLDPVRLTFYNLTNNEAVSTVRTAADLERAADEIRAVAALVRQQLFDPAPGFVCRRCDYVPICPAHEK